jgi:hypothetical protein
MHEFESEVRTSDQIQTVKIAVGATFDMHYYLDVICEYCYEFALWEIVYPMYFYPIFINGGKIMEHMNAKFEVRTRKSDGFCSVQRACRGKRMLRPV